MSDADGEGDDGTEDAPAAGTPGRGREVWIEKYRPQSLDDIKGQETITDRLQSYITRQDLPHLMFAGPAGVGKCATGETPVLTDRGLEPIGSVVGDADGFAPPDDGLEVLTLGDDGEFEYVEPSHVFGKQADELVRVRTRDGNDATVTPEHRLLTVTDEGLDWKRAEELSGGERVARPLAAPLPEGDARLEWTDRMDGERIHVHVTESFARTHGIPFEERLVGTMKRVVAGLRRGEEESAIAERAGTTLSTVQSYRRKFADADLDAPSTVCSLSFLRDLDIPRERLREGVTGLQYVAPNGQRSDPIEPAWEVTPDLARFLGLAIAEARLDGARIKFYNTSGELLDGFETAAESVFGVTPRRGEQGGVPYRAIGNRTLTHLLESCFDVFDGATGGDGIGSTILRADAASRRAFLRAVFDAEAHVSENGHIELAQKNERLITLLSYLLAGVGVPSRRKTERKTATNGTGTEREYHVLYLSGAPHLARFEERVGFAIDEKADRLATVAAREGNPNDDTVPIQQAVDTLCERLYLTKTDHVPPSLNPETPGREIYLDAAESVLDAATAKLETAQETLEWLERLRADLDAVTTIPATWAEERDAPEPMATRRPLSETTGVRTDRLLEYADGRRAPGADRAATILRELGAFDDEPPLERIRSELDAAIDDLGIPYNHVAEKTGMRGTDLGSLLDGGNDLASLSRFGTVADRVRAVAAGMLDSDVVAALGTLDRLTTADLYFDEVETVEHLDEARRVYDLTVPGTRNYVAGDVPTVMHNTTAATAIAKTIYGDDWRENFLELNASDERGIDVVRDRIKGFARSSFGGYDYRIVFLDEADALCLPPGTPVVTGPPSKPEVKPIEEVSEDGEPILSVDFATNELQPDRGRLRRTGAADFYRIRFSDGRETVASTRHPFFVVGEDEQLVEREVRALSAGDEVADFRDEIGLSRCGVCGDWTGNSRFCSQECADAGHSDEMSGHSNSRHGETAWNRGLTKEDDPRVAAQANPGEENGNYGGAFHGPNPWDDPEIAAELREKISDAMSERGLSEEHRRAIGIGLLEHHGEEEIDVEEYEPHYRRIVPDESTVECEICGEERRTAGRDGIYVHHIDGDRSNDDESNLMLVCPRCHNFVCHDRTRDMVEGWRANPNRTDVTDGGRATVATVEIEDIEFDHHGPAYNITMEGTSNFALGNGLLTHNTDDAQGALRRTMEQFSNNTRFILSCNYSSRIIDPIQSRCAVFRFSPLPDEAIAAQVREIAEAEDIEITEGGVDALVYAADGDMRKAINGLQAAAVMGGTVDEEAVYAITSTARPEEIREMVESALDGDFTAARSRLDELLTETGLAGGDVIDQMHRSVWEFDLDDRAAVRLMDRIGEADYRITAGANERVQLEALLASLALDEE